MTDRYCAHCRTYVAKSNFCPNCGRNAVSVLSVQPTPRSNSRLWKTRLERLVSVRVGCAAFLFAGVASYIATLVWKPLAAIVFWPVFGLVILAAVFNDDNVLYLSTLPKAGEDRGRHLPSLR